MAVLGSTRVYGNLTVSGEARADNFITTSSIEYKENVSGLNTFDCLKTVQMLNPVEFNWKESGEHDHGLIAQEVQAIAPYMATDEGVNYSKLVVYLIGAVQELKKEIDELK